MKRIRIFIIITVLAGVMFVLSGCAYYNCCFYFKFKGEYMADKYVDMLIPLDETDELYIDFNHENIRKCQGKKDLITEIPENSEIVNYNKNGYRSMLVHTKDSSLDIIVKDSESISDYKEEYNGTPYEITQNILLPKEWCRKYHDRYGEWAFLEFCNKYKKCYVAIFDKDGNILQISKRVPLVSLDNFYINDTTFYDVEKNKIKSNYIASVDIFVFIVILLFLVMPVSMLGCFIILIVDKIRQNKPIVSYKGYIIASSICNIPALMFIITYIYYTFGKLSIIVNPLLIIPALSITATVGTLIHFIRFEKKLRMKRYLEEKYREEHLDISEKM